MSATKSIAPAIKAITSTTNEPFVEADLDKLDDPTMICRDESCAIVEIHAAHDPPRSARGAPPKHCPSCSATIPRGQGAYCSNCGWDRRGARFAEQKRKEESNA